MSHAATGPPHLGKKAFLPQVRENLPAVVEKLPDRSVIRFFPNF
jgi:hypothetical protein